MIVNITKPTDFQYGVWKIEINLDGQELGKIKRERLIFDIPSLPERFFRVENHFKTAAPAENENIYFGQFLNGQWQGIVQANGVNEDKCTTTIEQVKVELEKNINVAIARFNS